MASKKEQSKRKGYSLAEIKNKYLPNRDMTSLEQQEAPLTRDAYLDILKRVSRTEQPDKGSSESAK